MRKLLLGVGLVVATLMVAADAQAGGRAYWARAEHPYHAPGLSQGWYAYPPVSSYSAVTLRPPIAYGAPAYYYPESYLAVDPVYAYPTAYPYSYYYPAGPAGYYYMSAHGYMTVYPW